MSFPANGLTNNFWLKGLVGYRGTAQPGQEVTARFGKDSDLIVSGYRGKYAEMATNGMVFSASVAAVTLPVNAGTLASKFALYNPVGSQVNLEIIDVEAHAVLATTVVDALGLYYSNGSNASGATFTTAGTIQSGMLGAGRGPVATFWSAATHVGTPVLARLVGGWGAVTDGGATPIRKEFNGSLIIPPGTLVSAAMTTAASTGSGITMAMTWAETPI